MTVQIAVCVLCIHLEYFFCISIFFSHVFHAIEVIFGTSFTVSVADYYSLW